MREPVTTDERISYVDRHGMLVLFDRPASCGDCRTCLTTNERPRRCMYLSQQGIVLPVEIEGVAP